MFKTVNLIAALVGAAVVARPGFVGPQPAPDDAVVLFDAAHFGGARAVLSADAPDLRKVQWVGADGRPATVETVSSIRMPIGWTVTLCSEAGFRGDCVVLTVDVENLSKVDGPCDSSNFNNCARSATVVPPSRQRRQAIVARGEPVRRPLSVSSRRGWQYTGVVVNEGDVLIICAWGRVDLGGGFSVTPDGGAKRSETGRSGPLCDRLLCRADTPMDKLVGRIGWPDLSDVTTGFPVGRNLWLPATQSGRLYLGVNDMFVRVDRRAYYDGGLDDNSGAFEGEILVLPARSKRLSLFRRPSGVAGALDPIPGAAVGSPPMR